MLGKSVVSESFQEILDRYGIIFLIVLAAALSFSTYIRFPICYDDAYITFRYARRLAQGLDFTYNDGIRSLGTTTPLFTIVLAFLARIFSIEYIPEIARFLGSVGFAFSTYFIYRIVEKLTNLKNPALITAFIYATYPPSIQSSATGMEIPVFIAVILLSYLLMLEGKSFLPGIAAGILVTLRPDGVIWALALGFGFCNKLSKLLRYFLGFMMIFIPLIIALTSYFGNPLPLSIIAKTVSYGPLYKLDFANLIHVLGIFFPNRITQHILLVLLLWAIILAFTIYSTRRSLKLKDVRLLPAAGYTVLYPGFLWYGRTLMFEWYGYLLFPILLILIFPIIYRLTINAFTIGFRKTAALIGTIILLTWCVLFSWRVFFFQPAYGQGGPGLNDLEQRALYFRDYTSPDSKIFTESIPQVGYISGRHIICEIGLVSPEVVELKKRYGDKILENCKWYFDVLREYKPDYLLLHAANFNRNRLFPYENAAFFSDIEDSIYFFENYEPVDEQDIIASGNYTDIIPGIYYLFKRKDQCRLPILKSPPAGGL